MRLLSGNGVRWLQYTPAGELSLYWGHHTRGGDGPMAGNEPDERPPILNIAGERVSLGPLRRDLLPLYQRWINDWDVTYTLGHALRPMTVEAEESWYESVARGGVQFQIYERDTLRPIGTTGLHDIDHQHRTATWGILIGEKDCWGKGYGTETARLMLDYGFTVLGLFNIMLQVFSYNERGIRAYRRAGFREIGRRRSAHRLGDQAHDIIFMDCLASEFESPVLKQRLL
jgi:RimJ/RimL family protein N-acetyltransferase